MTNLDTKIRLDKHGIILDLKKNIDITKILAQYSRFDLYLGKFPFQFRFHPLSNHLFTDSV